MAESVVIVRLLLPKLESLIAGEWKLVAGVQQLIKDLKDELESMLQALREADAKGESNKTWVKQIREAAYDSEDIIDEFVLKVGQSHGRGFISSLRQAFHIGAHGYDCHLIGKDLQEIEARVRKIAERNNRYPSEQVAEDTSFDEHNWASIDASEAEIPVGLDEPIGALMGLLGNAEAARITVSVLGMGGVGKSTLAEQVYNNDQVTSKSSTCHAWISIAQQSKAHELLQSLIKQWFEASDKAIPEGLGAKNVSQLVTIIQDFLSNKRYFVVLDNLLSTELWRSMTRAFLDNGLGSRIVVTTRIDSVANSSATTPGHVYCLKPLDEKDSRKLFCKTAFPKELDGQCPGDLQTLSWNIVEKCGGIPLAITVIGGLLPKTEKERTAVRWKQFYDCIPFLMAKNEDLKKMGKVLMLGYNELPYYLKPCFLYFSLFPKSRHIKCSRLVRLWIAEGFVEQEQGMALEDIAEAYLNELINRNMVEVAKFDLSGRPRSCRVHDLLWDNVLKRAQEENFSSSLDRSVASIPRKMRRLSIRAGVADIQAPGDFSHIRSFFVFGRQGCTASSLEKFFTSFRLLKVLDLKGAPLKEFPAEIVDLLFLRYLSLRRTKVSVLPKSVRKLQNLETLDLKGTLISELPTEILSLRNLRHLLVFHYEHPQFPYSTVPSKRGAKISTAVGSLGALQKLSLVDMSRLEGHLREFASLTKLRRLGITGLRREDGVDLCLAIKTMDELQSIHIRSDEGQLLDLQSLRSPPTMLQRVYLHGLQARLPPWLLKARNLVKLSLLGSRLGDDPFEALQSLPNLLELHLIQAYQGTELCCGEKGFQKLKVLELQLLNKLQVLRLEKGAMPELHKLAVQHCGSLQKVSMGKEQHTNLKEIHVDGVRIEYLEEENMFVQLEKRELGLPTNKKQNIQRRGIRYGDLMDIEDP